MAGFTRLPGVIPGIIGFECGANVSRENRNCGMTHLFNLTFATEADRDAYLLHPAHNDFAAGLDGFVEDVVVFDYEVPGTAQQLC